MSYLARYEAGEHERVWTELRALGAAALNAEHLADARNVADATMRRALSNLQRIEAGLRAIGYVFETSAPPPLDPGRALSATRLAAEETVLGLGLDPAMTAQLLASLDQTLGPAAGNSNENAAGQRVRASALGDPHLHLDQLDRFERLAGPAPLALGSFWRTVGWVDFTGTLPVTVIRGPLILMPPVTLADDYEAHVEDNGGDAGFAIELVADADGDELDPLIAVPVTSGADARLPDGEWFVDYLRGATRAAGLPGMAVDAIPGLANIAADWEPF
ncbi:hypothetical protein [Sphingomonas sp. LaA6.9]|uniref:hypothetical protein n=1 Tax=Sphingomonas sp. LaA6.9 TaxID=2919914 RepID=UPI001F4F9B0C|nr:hypothetical protein [Sphingomonas sp. LaA6.9]MCJ8158422.1 hypothetical protein [Sphingomonas sp. LaA6.9]